MRTLRRFLKRLTSWTTTQAGEDRRAVEAIKEDYREQRTLPFLDTLLRDTRYALRRLRKAPVFTFATILTLALGIGATTSIFTLVHAVVLQTLAVANPNQLYRLGKESRCCYFGGYSQANGFSIVSYDLYQHLRDNTTGFAELAAFSASEKMFGVRRKGISEPAQTWPGEFVSGNYFAMFGLRAFAGRFFTAHDDQPGAPPVAVMSDRLWRDRYAADPSLIGSIFNLNDKPFTIIGIAPPQFFGDTLRNRPPDFFLPLNTEPYVESDSDLNIIDSHWLDLIGRIRPGASPLSVEAQMRIALQQWLRAHWGQMDSNDRARLPQQTLYLAPGGAGITSMREQYQRWLAILMTVSAFVLLIVCANVANLMLVRSLEQRSHISLAMALGARPSRVIRQPLAESLVLALAGGAAGLAVAFATTRLILHYAFPTNGAMAAVPISASPSLAVLLFTFGISLLAGVSFGIAPAWMATRVDPIEALRGAHRSTVRTGSLPRKTLVILQAALSLVLLCAAGLLTAALDRLEHQNFGFEQDHRIIASIDPRLAGYGPSQLTPLYQRLHDALSRLPDVSAVALCIYSPMGGNNWGSGVWIDGHPTPGPHDDNFAFWDRVTAGYFAAIGNPILRGRAITEFDTAASPHVAVINEAFARKFFPGEDPLGKHFGGHGIGTEREREIVGIAQDARYLTLHLDQPVGPFYFLPESQHEFLLNAPSTDANAGSHFLHDIVIVTRPGAVASPAQVRQAIASVDPNLPISSIRPLQEQVSRQFTQQRLIAHLTSFFGLLSLVLATIGIYGVTAYNAHRRVNEIGVRMALGATRGNIIALVLRGAFLLILLGLACGLPLALLAGRLLDRQLYGLNPYHPTVIVYSVLALAISALVASLVPAFRASSISPAEAVRTE